ncbi:MAG: prephenate dehydrogenase/arogenate dehydrogenase family protein [Mariprofundales bacterium]
MALCCRHLVIIGVGLIGGSVARALRQAEAVEYITGVGRNSEALRLGVRLGVIDGWSTDIASAVRNADLVLISVPMQSYATVLSLMAGNLSAGTVVTDAGSVKQYAADLMRSYLDDTQYIVPAHPIAGTEQSGIESGFASLFEKRLCVITPDKDTDAGAIAQVEKMWILCGAHICNMSANDHDNMLAAVSHLPHLAAYALVNAVLEHENTEDGHNAFEFAAGGFRDFTRIASSPPIMWRDIAISNRMAVLKSLDAMQVQLTAIRKAVDEKDDNGLLKLFDRAKNARDNWVIQETKQKDEQTSNQKGERT